MKCFLRSSLAAACLFSGVLLSVPAHAGRVFEIRVLDEEQSGITADVIRILSTGREEWLARTDQAGAVTFEPPIRCAFNHRILVRPDAPLVYQQPEYQACKEKLLFVLKRWVGLAKIIAKAPDRHVIKNLLNQVDALESEEEFGALALVYTELSNRFRRLNSDLADQMRQQAYLYAGRNLSIDGALAFDSAQKTSVMSRQLKTALVEFQQRMKLTASARLDSATLQAMAGKPHWHFLYGYESASPIGGPGPEVHPWEVEETRKIVENLVVNAEVAVKKQDYGLAALLYTETAQRFTDIDEIGAARNAEKESYSLVGRALGVKPATTYDPVQGKWVMSKELRRALKEYQAIQNLPVSGQLDYRTLRRLAGGNVGQYLYHVPGG